MAQSRDMQIRCHFLDLHTTVNATCRSVGTVVVRWRILVASSHGVLEPGKKAARTAGLAIDLCRFELAPIVPCLESSGLHRIKCCPVTTEAIAEMQTFSDGVSKIDRQEATRHGDNHVNIEDHGLRKLRIDRELLVGPAPDIFVYVVHDQKQRDQQDENSPEPATGRLSLVSRRELGEGIELLHGRDAVELG